MPRKNYRRGPDKQIGTRTIPKKKKKRKCMMCEKDFISSWIGHRICTPCKSTGYSQTGGEYSIMAH